MARSIFLKRIQLSMYRWSIKGVSNGNMRRLWIAFLAQDNKYSSRRKLCQLTGLPLGSFEPELYEMDLAGLLETFTGPDGTARRRLTPAGYEIVRTADPATYDWMHPSWKRAKPDPPNGLEGNGK